MPHKKKQSKQHNQYKILSDDKEKEEIEDASNIEQSEIGRLNTTQRKAIDDILIERLNQVMREHKTNNNKQVEQKEGEDYTQIKKV